MTRAIHMFVAGRARTRGRTDYLGKRSPGREQRPGRSIEQETQAVRLTTRDQCSETRRPAQVQCARGGDGEAT
jgi:hypothetical protein